MYAFLRSFNLPWPSANRKSVWIFKLRVAEHGAGSRRLALHGFIVPQQMHLGTGPCSMNPPTISRNPKRGNRRFPSDHKNDPPANPPHQVPEKPINSYENKGKHLQCSTCGGIWTVSKRFEDIWVDSRLFMPNLEENKDCTAFQLTPARKIIGLKENSCLGAGPLDHELHLSAALRRSIGCETIFFLYQNLWAGKLKSVLELVIRMTK